MGKWLNGAREVRAATAAVAGMLVRENGETYVCTRDIDPLLYPPSQVAAQFNGVTE